MRGVARFSRREVKRFAASSFAAHAIAVTELYGAEANDVAAFIGLAVELSPLAGSHRPDLNPSLPHSPPGIDDTGIAFLYDDGGSKWSLVRDKASLIHATCRASTCAVAAFGDARCSSMATIVRASRPRSRRFSSLRASSSAIAQQCLSSLRDMRRRRTAMISNP